MIRPTSYVLSGSGTKFFVFIGALRVLFAAGRLPKRIMGTSGGGLVALYVAAHYNHRAPLEVIDALEDFARGFEIDKLLDLGGIRWPQFWHGLYKGDKILAVLRQALPADWGKLTLPAYVVTSDRTADACKVWGADDKVEPAIAGRATMSLPGFDAVQIKGHWHTDGGTRANYPLDYFNDVADSDVVGLRFRPRADKAILHPGVQGRAVQSFKNKVEFNLDNIDDMIEGCSTAHMAAALKARTIMLDAPGSGLAFKVSQQDADEMIRGGEASASAWLKANP
jgi:predicted acylesterase/phospholipase RssA